MRVEASNAYNTKSDRWVSSGHSGFLLHEDHPNATIGANEHAE